MKIVAPPVKNTSSLLIFGGRDIDHIFVCGQWKTDLVENPPESEIEAKSKLEKIPFKRMAKMIGLSSFASLLEHKAANRIQIFAEFTWVWVDKLTKTNKVIQKLKLSKILLCTINTHYSQNLIFWTTFFNEILMICFLTQLCASWKLVDPRKFVNKESESVLHCVLRAWKSFKVDSRGHTYVFKSKIA